MTKLAIDICARLDSIDALVIRTWRHEANDLHDAETEIGVCHELFEADADRTSDANAYEQFVEFLSAIELPTSEYDSHCVLCGLSIHDLELVWLRHQASLLRSYVRNAITVERAVVEIMLARIEACWIRQCVLPLH